MIIITDILNDNITNFGWNNFIRISIIDRNVSISKRNPKYNIHYNHSLIQHPYHIQNYTNIQIDTLQKHIVHTI